MECSLDKIDKVTLVHHESERVLIDRFHFSCTSLVLMVVVLNADQLLLMKLVRCSVCICSGMDLTDFLGLAIGPCSNWNSVGFESSRAALQKVIDESLEQAKIKHDEGVFLLPSQINA